MSSPIVFSLTAPQCDGLATLATCRAFWPTIRRPVRAALHRAGLVSSIIRPALTDAGKHAAQLALVLVAARASLASDQRGPKHGHPHAEFSSVGLARIASKASPINGTNTQPALVVEGAA